LEPLEDRVLPANFLPTFIIDHPSAAQPYQSAAPIGFIPPYANGGAGTQTVRVDLPNPTNRDAGQKVLVRLPDRIAQAADTAQTASSK